MSKINKKVVSVFNTAPAESRVASGLGAVADKITPEQNLRRCVLTNLLWEDVAYEDGQEVSKKIQSLIPLVAPEVVAQIAIEAKEKSKLRHTPLFIVREMARHDSHKSLVSSTLFRIIQRADELTDFLALYWRDGRCSISHQVKKGLAEAFTKFDEYALSKYNRGNAIKLRDVLFLSHAKPKDEQQQNLWRRLINNELTTPDTWENEISQSKDKKASWTRLIQENKIGALATLRNIRNMKEAGVNVNDIRAAIRNTNPSKLLPFNFIVAAKHNPEFEGEIEHLMFKCLESFEKIQGKTIFVVDVSGSMQSKISEKSELLRLDAAIALTILMREICEQPIIYATAGSDGNRTHKTEIVSARRGFALGSQILKQANTLGGGGIFTVQCTNYIKDIEGSADRMIILSDSQDMDRDVDPNCAANFANQNYLIDISCNTKGVAYKKFHQINGWSEHIIGYIQAFEKQFN